VLLALVADRSQRGAFKYELPENLTEVHEVYLDDLDWHAKEKNNKKPRLNGKEVKALRSLVFNENVDWDTLFSLFAKKNIKVNSLLMGPEFLQVAIEYYEAYYNNVTFADFLWTLRSVYLPLFIVLKSEIPEADLFHCVSTGYAGILARLGSYKYHVPFLLTEHGIYTREREEEIIRAGWVLPDFKDMWISFFYMLSSAAYDGAAMVTSLFQRAGRTQIEIGADPSKCRSVANGIHYDRFAGIPERKPGASVQIGAILRIAPIKDVKTMLYAFAEVERNIPDVKLFIAGPEDDPDYALECRELMRQLRIRNAVFMGTINVLDYMGDFDFTVLSSISEGQPLSVLESFAAGRPCVTTDVGCCKELIYGEGDDHLGQAGYCVPPMQPHALAQAMEDLCRNSARRLQMGRIARQRAGEYFRHEDMIANYLDTYDEVFRRWYMVE
jgi:glycosyltransferase involved in cell wall biosynthesis